MAGDKKIVRALLARHGRTFAEELGIDIAKGTPSPLFRLLCMATLMSARIDSGIAAEATRALASRGWRSQRALAQSTWEERVEALNAAGYARYQERTATTLGDLSEQLNERYKGDLRRLREDADRAPARERELLEEFKGVGDVGADIFLREVQVIWDELFPFADRRALAAAKRLGLPAATDKLVVLAGRSDYPRLVAALVRVELDDDYAAVREAAKA